MREVAQVVSTRGRYKAKWKSSKFDAARIEIIFEKILELSRELLKTGNHSRQYWYQLIRRFAPLLWDELQALNPQAKVTPDWFAEVVKGASHLALQCTGAADPWEWVDEDGGRGIDYRHLSQEDLVVAAQIFSLAQLRYEAQVRFRFACKGFRVFAASNEEDTLAAQDIQSITHYEERRKRYDSLAGSAGLWCHPATSSPVRPNLCHWFGLRTAAANHFQLLSRNPKAEIDIQYLLSPLSEIRFKPGNEAGIGSSPEPSFVPYDYLISYPSVSRAFETAFDVEVKS